MLAFELLFFSCFLLSFAHKTISWTTWMNFHLSRAWGFFLAFLCEVVKENWSSLLEKSVCHLLWMMKLQKFETLTEFKAVCLHTCNHINKRRFFLSNFKVILNEFLPLQTRQGCLYRDKLLIANSLKHFLCLVSFVSRWPFEMKENDFYDHRKRPARFDETLISNKFYWKLSNENICSFSARRPATYVSINNQFLWFRQYQ